MIGAGEVNRRVQRLREDSMPRKFLAVIRGYRSHPITLMLQLRPHGLSDLIGCAGPNQP